MRAVAVGAGRDAREPELRHLAVERVAVRSRSDSSWQVPHSLSTSQLPGIGVGLRWMLVRGVAVGADRRAGVALRQRVAVDARLVWPPRSPRGTSPHVAGDVGPETRLAGSVCAPDVVGAVAVGAVRRHHQPALAERLAVDAVLELRRDVADRDVALADDLGVAVAAAARRRQFR